MAAGYFYAMEFIDGETVSARIIINGTGPLDCLLLSISLSKVAFGIDRGRSFQRLVPSRHLKPSNLDGWFREGGRRDFWCESPSNIRGLARKPWMDCKSTAELTVGGFSSETPYFASVRKQIGSGQTERYPVRHLILSGVTLWFPVNR